MFGALVMIAAGASSLGSIPTLAISSDDVKCLVLSSAFGAKGSTEEAKKVAQSAAFFYMGRIDGRLTDAQIRTAVALEQKALKAASAGVAMKACAKKMHDSAQKLQRAVR